jgi:phenylpropionate dioxygenase-like ring-hydroxylating dioxygenase large terminal subunit
MVDRKVESALQSVPLRVTNPELIPAARYYDPVFFALEKEKLWPHVWQMACRLEEIPEVGDYTEYVLFEKTVIIVRAKSGIKAFHNVCRHRGTRLVDGPGNCKTKGFVCPFHGWRYNLGGENTFVFGRGIFSEEVLDKSELHLKPCRVETWGGCAFITFDDDAPPLTEFLGPITAKLDIRNADKVRTEWWRASVLPVNWKLAVEAFVEMYHLMRTHPQLHSATPGNLFVGDTSGVNPSHQTTGREAVTEHIRFLARLTEGMGGLLHQTELAVLERLEDMEVPDDPGAATMAFFAYAREELMREGRARGLPIHDMHKAAELYPTASNEFLFPNFFLLPMFGSMMSYRIRPLTPETCLFELWSLILVPEGEPYESPKQPTVLPHDSPDYPLVVRQDYAQMPEQQRGLRTGEIEYQRLSFSHEGMISNFERVIDGYLAGLDSDRLVKAINSINGGSFVPIHDIGF